jgi:hypothetical protein
MGWGGVRRGGAFDIHSGRFLCHSNSSMQEDTFWKISRES